MKKYLLKLFFFFQFSILCSFGQNVDSLTRILDETYDINEKIKILSKLSKEYITINTDSAHQMAKRALRLANISGSKEFLGEIHACLGDVAVTRDSLDKATTDYLIALEYFEQSHQYHDLISVFLVLGNIDLIQDKLPEAMYNYLNAVKIAEDHEIRGPLPFLYNNIGIINYKSEQYNEAFEYLTKGLQGFELTKDSMNFALALSNIGMVFCEFNELDIAEEHYIKAMDYYQELGDKLEKALTMISLGQLERKRGNYEKSLEFLQKSIEIFQRDDPSYLGPRQIHLASIHTNLGITYFLMEGYSLALHHLTIGYQLGVKYDNPSNIRDAAEFLQKVWEKKGRLDSSLFYFRVYKQYSDSIDNEKNIRNLARQEMQFLFDQKIREEQILKEQEISRRKRMNLLYIILLTLLVSFIIMLILFLKLGKNKVKRAELERKNLENELEFKNKELTTNVMYLLKKNEFLLSISEKLKKVNLHEKAEKRKFLNEIISELESSSAKDTWKEFEVRFQQVHNDFYEKINVRYPDLSPNELRLCAFLKLNMTTKDIAAITYQSLNSIDIARFRLRKKLGLKKDENLIAFLTKF